MGFNLAQKIIGEHLVEGDPQPGTEIGLRIDHTLTYDTLGPLTLLEFEAMEIPRVRAKLSVCYTDHNMLQLGFESADDHRFLQTMSAKFGLRFSRAGNGICHQLHLERFSEPGVTLLGTDSHTPTCGSMAMIAIGAGGLDVAVAMGGGPYYLHMPRVIKVNLKGQLQPWVSGKDVILEMLRRLSVKGGVGCIFEYAGEGVKSLSVTQRATICNMGTELGATTSIFPSDEVTRSFLRAQKREAVWRPLEADSDAEYDDVMEIDLDQLEPLVACPSSPDAVVPVREIEGTRVDQVCIGSCTNSSLSDLLTVAAVLRGKVVPPSVSLTVTPGTRQAFQMISRLGALTDLIDAGARVLESTCGPCIGMGQSPGTGAVSIRTFNRNFPGRSGTVNDRVYLCSPEVAAVTALAGEITDPRRLGSAPSIELPQEYVVDDRLIVPPSDHPESVEIIRGPNIQPLPALERAAEVLRGGVLLKLGDNVSTDDIVPGGSKAVPLRANVPALSEFAFSRIDTGFPERARKAGGGIIVGGTNYGQGSSREHAAVCPRFLGVRAVLAKSFARIHHSNLVNFGILPLTFADASDYDGIDEGDELEMAEVAGRVTSGHDLVIRNLSKGAQVKVKHALTPRQVAVYLEGGLLNYFKRR